MIPRLRRPRAHTLIETAFATAVFAMMGLIVYGVASEGLFAFSRNVSINRSYGEARGALERIGNVMQTAGYQPQMLDGTGAITTVSPAAGFRVWRYGSTPCYNITTPSLSLSTITVDLRQPGNTGVLQPAPVIGDLITIAALGFQAQATNVVATGNSAVITFANKFSTYTTLTSIPTQTTGTPAVTIQYSCLDWTSAAVIAVSTPYGTQLRYYSTFFPGTSDVNTSGSYKFLANLIASVGGNTTPLPFSLGPTPSLNVDLYAQAPDYNNRTRDIGSANTYTFLATAYSPRNPSILNSPY